MAFTVPCCSSEEDIAPAGASGREPKVPETWGVWLGGLNLTRALLETPRPPPRRVKLGPWRIAGDGESFAVRLDPASVSTTELARLYGIVGWHVPPEENFGRALAGTYFSLAARDPEGRLIGYGRVVSDAAAQTTLPGCFFTFCPTRYRR